MKIEFQMEGDVAETIRQKAGVELDSARSTLVRDAAIQTLQRVIPMNPVETARSRAAWVSMLEELGGTAPAGWEGPHPSAIEQGRQLGQTTSNDTASQSEIRLANGVSYVSYLEYGTSRMAPLAMARTALRQVAGQLASLFRWPQGGE